MTVKQRTSLGRNLSALLSQSTATLLADDKDTPNPDNFTRLSIQSLQPSQYQPRRELNEESLASLAASIKKQGLLQPLVVRKIDTEHYEILAGERRWRAAQLAGLTDIPVMIKEVDNKTAMAIALVENLQREDLNPLEEAHAMQRLLNEFDLTHQQIAGLVGKSRAAVSNSLRLLTLSDNVKNLLESGKLDMGHARALLALPSEQQTEIAALIIAKDLSVRATEQLIQRLKNDMDNSLFSEPKAKVTGANELFRHEAKRLAEQLKTRVRIQQKESGKGTIIIHFDSPEILENIMGRIS